MEAWNSRWKEHGQLFASLIWLWLYNTEGKNAVLSFLSYLVNHKRGYEEATGNDNDIHMSYQKQSNECKDQFKKIVSVGKQT